MVTLTKERLHPLLADCCAGTFRMNLQGAYLRCSHSRDAGLLLNKSLNPKVHTMNVSSRTVVILNILSATGLLLILAERFHWF
ncbi:stress response membrane protein YncL [Enterobacter ludwigii]|uniref:stress response membrane protein YncL n=1 Tax=Enterobacter ludwigii TaxID=299767 RepID=UPI002889BFE4|nr:stress response membrane protein YncL [Enterobacter ludwigii]WNI74554.1 stress response membrane protein YncL [Enterobacter ludwigii]